MLSRRRLTQLALLGLTIALLLGALSLLRLDTAGAQGPDPVVTSPARTPIAQSFSQTTYLPLLQNRTSYQYPFSWYLEWDRPGGDLYMYYSIRNGAPPTSKIHSRVIVFWGDPQDYTQRLHSMDSDADVEFSGRHEFSAYLPFSGACPRLFDWYASIHRDSWWDQTMAGVFTCEEGKVVAKEIELTDESRAKFEQRIQELDARKAR